jgi:predicted transcriptional regulator
MDILYRRGQATGIEVMEELSGTPHYSTVRTQLRVLEEKGYVRHAEKDLRYVYLPAVPQDAVKQSALKQLIDTFFEGSVESVVAALLGYEGSRLPPEKLKKIADMVEQACASEGVPRPTGRRKRGNK